MSFLTSWRHVDVIFLPNVDANILKRSWTEHFLIEKCSYFGVKLIKQYIFKSKCNCRRKSMQEYARKRICNGRSVRIDNSVTRDNCSASLGKPRDAKQLPSWWNFQSAPHTHERFVYSHMWSEWDSNLQGYPGERPIWATSWENLFLSYAHNKGADQTA